MPVAIGETCGVPAEAFAEPAFQLSINGGQGWKNYMKLNAQISIAKKYISMVGDIYDPTATIFMREMHRSLPNASAPSIKWSYLFAVAVTAAALAESGRIEVLSNNKIKSSHLIQAYNHAKIPFHLAEHQRNCICPIIQMTCTDTAAIQFWRGSGDAAV